MAASQLHPLPTELVILVTSAVIQVMALEEQMARQDATRGPP